LSLGGGKVRAEKWWARIGGIEGTLSAKTGCHHGILDLLARTENVHIEKY
jgi:hypothetical protein